ncbi:MAG TPA: tRNA (N(6)-L-threonylcarbamoyladenosine(37)-C(2))-methylthiotransferase MtaB [Candidatus Ornithomonoglobus merdipullorum]|uniref:Threonylcarbamoyladenosine tRNA methylthiotransferase MtaB n=1 Tax=Candidatus Ornithomonoglobus merdipullorum TaxID=2840895 RepID=A0A9D1SFH5_9FIRM|nr:tRNA (N(6)-L-threonylcarbamoyladenosine(37)-C(2))-methylthiotransferase MtaB [Candidatus Ornithomonoglobus merdipullorum]
MKTAAFYTLGCKVNQYETEAVEELFEKNGYTSVPFSEKADCYIINTCSVTSMSDRKSRQMIRRARKTNPDALIAVMGCYSQTAPDEVLAIDGVNLVLGTKDKSSAVRLMGTLKQGDKLNAVTDVRDNHTFEELRIERCTGKTRAYIKIQDGCSQFCSYCIIPYARGPVRSRPEDEIVCEVKKLAEAGYKEVILTGIHAAAYGQDLQNTSLDRLLNRLDTIDGIERIRLSSIEPMTLNSDFIDGIRSCKNLCPHFHISLQSGCDETLRRMNRHYTTEQFEGIVNGLRGAFPGCAVTTDIMTGFAGETDEEFEKTLEFVKHIKFADAHVFQYSRRRGTPAAKRPGQVPPEIKEARSKAIMKAVAVSKNEFLQNELGKTVDVLFETKTKDGLYEGKTANYITVHAPSDENISGRILKTALMSTENGIIFGKTVD